MKILQIFALVFIGWEIIKLIIMPFVWKQAKLEYTTRILKTTEKNPNALLEYADYIYIIFNIFLIFSSWWKLGLLLALLSIVSGLSLYPFVKLDKPLNFQVFFIIITDTILSILILSGVYNPLNLWK